MAGPDQGMGAAQGMMGGGGGNSAQGWTAGIQAAFGAYFTHTLKKRSRRAVAAANAARQAAIGAAKSRFTEGYGVTRGTLTSGYSSARDALTSALNTARGDFSKGFDDAIVGLKSYRATGNASLRRLELMLTDPTSLNMTAAYKFNQAEGLKALEYKARAGGKAYSGEAMKEAMGYTSGLASQEYEKEFARNAGLAQLGFGAEQSAAQLSAERGKSLAELESLRGQSMANLHTTEATNLGQLEQNYYGNMANLDIGVGASTSQMHYDQVDIERLHTQQRFEIQDRYNQTMGYGGYGNGGGGGGRQPREEADTEQPQSDPITHQT